jgi:hypothetical protein
MPSSLVIRMRIYPPLLCPDLIRRPQAGRKAGRAGISGITAAAVLRRSKKKPGRLAATPVV